MTVSKILYFIFLSKYKPAIPISMSGKIYKTIVIITNINGQPLGSIAPKASHVIAFNSYFSAKNTTADINANPICFV